MSSGGVSQLVAIGAQDVFLTGKPEVSFFQSAYKHHTNFSQVVARQVIQGTPSAGGMSSVRFERAGDMLGYVYISPICTIAGVPQTYQTFNWSNVINYVEFYIGGQLIDRQDSTFSELLAPNLFAQNVSKSNDVSNHGGYGLSSFFYPLRFWFCENAQSALPLVGLQYHDIEVRIYWSTNLNSSVASTLVGNYSDPAAPNSIINFELYSQYIYLDEAERAFFANKPQDMLITQVQYMNPTNNKMMPIVFNHPIKFICASAGTTSSVAGSSTNALTSNQNQIIIQVNGTDLADYKYACPHFTQVPTYYNVPFANSNASSYFIVPFCIDTSRLQPTGTLNFSRLDSFRIVSLNQNITSTVYGVNYNILRIQNGMGGLMYSN
jgi:hypothetical protein